MFFKKNNTAKIKLSIPLPGSAMNENNLEPGMPICDFYGCAILSKARFLQKQSSGEHERMSAFSLVEMLMAFLVASLLMAALAPVVTKKFNENVTVNAAATVQSKGWRLYTYQEDCTKADGRDNVCEFNDFKVPNGVFSLNLLMVSGGGGRAGATPANIEYKDEIKYSSTSPRDAYSNYDEAIIPITEFMVNTRIESLVGGGGGGAGGAGYVSGCPSGTYEVPGNGTVKSFCMTQFNMGEHRNNIQKRDEAYIPKCQSCWYYGSYDQSAVWDSKCGGAQKGMCCWYSFSYDDNSITANPNACSRTVGYNACIRTVCQKKKKKTGCSEFTYVPSGVQVTGWSLPSVNQFAFLRDTYNSNTLILGGQGLYLCSVEQLAGADQCATISNRCFGSENNLCVPGGVWVASTAGQESMMGWLLNRSDLGVAGLLGPVNANPLAAHSARCTLDKTKLFKSYSGAGGAGGSLLSNIDIQNYIKQAKNGGRIIIRAGRGGAGGNGANGNNQTASAGAAGYESCVFVQKAGANGNGYSTIYGICASAGKGGAAAAAIAASGSAASYTTASALNSCRETKDGANWVNINCSLQSKQGDGGEGIWGSIKQFGTGGRGGNSNFPSTASGGGEGANSASALNGGSPAAATYPGAGGGGGGSAYGFSNKILTGKGGSGAGGLVRITYQNEYPGAGGGGGAGGTMVKVSNISFASNKECTIHVGGGGDRGIGANGKDGGYTSIKCGINAQEYVVYGGGGGKAGISATQTNNVPEGGEGGSIQKVSQNILNLGALAEIIYGEAHTSPVTTDLSKEEYEKLKKKLDAGKTIGGSGGDSGLGATGGCGGLKIDNESSCINTSNTNALSAEYIAPIYTNLLNNDYGKAGAGGGGGGWSSTIVPKQGIGTQGQPGYLFLWWDQTGE